ncbi:MAG: GNAT family N-acetyltransferase [Oliverpabstia sp.]
MKISDGREVTVRRYQEQDAETIVSLIRRNFLEVNVKDYGENAMKTLAAHHDVNWFKGVASYANVYVFCINDEIVGVGSISSFWGSLTESILLTIFVLPELHGKGIGKFIIQNLEQDELFLRADRIEIPASITAIEFYKKQGYDYKNGVKELDDEGHYRLEKFNVLQENYLNL